MIIYWPHCLGENALMLTGLSIYCSLLYSCAVIIHIATLAEALSVLWYVSDLAGRSELLNAMDRLLNT
ncbi:hypothetical protein VN23_03770 [Janthinobacterium sp. B9-8]|nr:hypothetical protein VN23_03770 [Janthinobacterium sp. B9-8]